MSFKRRLQALTFVSPEVVVGPTPSTVAASTNTAHPAQNVSPIQRPQQQRAENAVRERDNKRQKLSEDGSGKAARAKVPSKDHLLELEKSLHIDMLNIVPTVPSALPARASVEIPLTTVVSATTSATSEAAAANLNTTAVGE